MMGPIIPWTVKVGRQIKRLPPGARRMCQRCQLVSFKAAHARRFCGGCSKNDHTRRRWKKAGCRETY